MSHTLIKNRLYIVWKSRYTVGGYKIGRKRERYSGVGRNGRSSKTA